MVAQQSRVTEGREGPSQVTEGEESAEPKIPTLGFRIFIKSI